MDSGRIDGCLEPLPQAAFWTNARPPASHREAGKSDCEQVGKHLMMFVGVIAVPEGVLKGEHQYAVSGYSDVLDDIVKLEVSPSSANPLTEIRHLAAPLGQLLLEPIWHV